MGFKDWLAKITGRARARSPTSQPSPAAPTEADILAALDRVEAMVAGGVGAGRRSQSRVQAGLVDRPARRMPRLRNLGLGSPQAYSVMATATDYLPEAIGGYLRLPREWADSRPIEGGKTSLMLLIDQLDLLGATMDKIFDAVVRVDADALIAHGRFLQEKFGHAPAPAPRPRPRRAAARASPRSSLDLP